MAKFYTAKDKLKFTRIYLDKLGKINLSDLSESELKDYKRAVEKEFENRRFLDLNDYSWKGRYR